MVLKHFRARYSKGVLEPLEAIDLEEGAEVLLTIRRVPSPKRDLEAFRRAAGGWKGHHDDPDELIRMLYESRITGSREPPSHLARIHRSKLDRAGCGAGGEFGGRGGVRQAAARAERSEEPSLSAARGR